MFLNEALEEWRKIYWINDELTKYSISNSGKVRNDKNGKILKTNFYKGYERVDLTHDGVRKQFFIHRLVAIAFIPNPENKPEVNHKDGDKSNNYDWNLEWATNSENMIHAVQNKLWKPTNRGIKLSDDQVNMICKLLEENKLTLSEIARITNTDRTTVSNILKRNTHIDISWKYDLDKYEIKTDFSHYGLDNHKTIFTDEEVENICKMIDSGNYSLPEISKITGITYQTVRNIYYGTCRRNISSKYNFMKTDKNPLYEQKRDMVIQICDLLDSGLNTKEVSEKMNVPRTLVRNIMAGTTWKDISSDYNFIKNKKKRKK